MINKELPMKEFQFEKLRNFPWLGLFSSGNLNLNSKSDYDVPNFTVHFNLNVHV